MLRQLNTNPDVCAWTLLKRVHDFNRQPLAPLGIEMHTFTPTGKRRSWGVKSEKCFYIGTSLEHYKYFNGRHPKTRSVQGSENVLFKHKYIPAPTVTLADTIVEAAKELEDVTKNEIPPTASCQKWNRQAQGVHQHLWPKFHNKGRGGECRTSEGGHQGRYHNSEDGKRKKVQRTNVAANRQESNFFPNHSQSRTKMEQSQQESDATS